MLSFAPFRFALVAACALLLGGPVLAAAAPKAAVSPVSYRLSGWDPVRRSLRVEVEVRADGPVVFALSRWVPGYYALKPLRAAVWDLAARVDGREVKAAEEPRSRWTIPAQPGSRVEVEYRLSAHDDATTRGMDHAFVDRESAFVLPAGCLLRVVGRESSPCEVEIMPAEGWTTASPLPLRDGRYRAKDWNELADSPLEAGRLRRWSFSERGLEYRVVTSGTPLIDRDRLTYLTRRAAATVPAMFGGAPYRDYTFFTHYGTGGLNISGLEHARCATMAYGGRDVLNEATYRKLPAQLVFHELFHAWNGKACRPEALVPYNFDQIPRLRSLWLAEGITTYYGYLLTRRSGVWSEGEFLAAISREYGRYLRSPGRRTTSLFDAGAFTFEDARYGEGRGTNYYTKGALVALLLDAGIRKRSHGARSLDDVMRWLYRTYSDRGYPDDVLPRAIRESTGQDWTAQCRQWLEKTVDLPVASVMAEFGFTASPGSSPRFAPLPRPSAEASRRRAAWLRVDP